MNETFNIKRFWAYLRRDFALNALNILVTLGVVMLLMWLGVWFWHYQHYPAGEGLVGFATVGGAALVLVRTSMIANTFQRKTACTDFLVLPASMLEKYVAKIIRHFLVPAIVVAATAWGVFYIRDAHDLHVAFVPLVSLAVFASGIFLFWGAVFRRFAAVVAVLVITAIILIIRYFRYSFNEVMMSMDFMWLDPVRVYVQSGDDPDTRLYVLLSILAALFFIGSAIAAYFIYRRKQQNVKPFNR